MLPSRSTLDKIENFFNSHSPSHTDPAILKMTTYAIGAIVYAVLIPMLIMGVILGSMKLTERVVNLRLWDE